MKRIYMLEDKFNRLIRENVESSDYSSGTDHPSFYDKKSDVWYEAHWDMTYGFPFGYWDDGNSYEFSVGDSYTTHENACGKVVEKYIEKCLYDNAYYYVDEFMGNLEDLLDTLNNESYGYTYNEDDDMWVSADGSDEISIDNFIDDNSYDIPLTIVSEFTYKALENKEILYSKEDVVEEYTSAMMEGLWFTDRDGINRALENICGMNFESYFQDGYGMGRIWPREGLITWYESEQPDPDMLRKTIYNLSQCEEIGKNYNTLWNDFFMIFTDFDNDNVVTGCSVADYASGNYGPDDEDGDDEVERERTYGDGNTQFIPHLASPEEKKRLDVYKGWREAGARKWAPRLKGFGGNMAAYRAARYPYSDSKIIHGNVLNETNSRIITESQVSKSISAAKRKVMQELGYNEKQADEFVRIKLRGEITSLRTNEGGRFIEGVARMWCAGQLDDDETKSRLNTTLKYIASDAHINEYSRDLNGMSAQDLIDRFASNIEMDLDNDRKKNRSLQFDGNSEYDIVRIDSFEQAEEYGDYTDWCVTHYEDMFNSYTHNGINQFYFCLKNDFYELEPFEGEGCPLDEYGLSMISVLVNENGSLVHCTCRWNHKNGGDDNVMDTEQISKVIKMYFYDVFKPNTMWRDIVNNAMQRIANGEKVEEVFEYCGDLSEGFKWVQLFNKRNLINQKCQLLTDLPTASESIKGKWFNWCSNFMEGYAEIELNNKYNFINGNGQLLTDLPTASESIKGKWFNYTHRFFNGFARVKLNHKYNFINQNGVIISDEWFDKCEEFSGGIAKVYVNDKWYLINKNGEIISNTGVDGFYGSIENFAVVYRYGVNNLMQYCKYNLMGENGQLITELPTTDEAIKGVWFEKTAQFFYGFAQIKLQGLCNYVNQNGELLYKKPIDQWFEKCTCFGKNGFAQVMLNDEWFYIDTNGNITKEQPQVIESRIKRVHILESKFKLVDEGYSETYNMAVKLLDSGYLIHGTKESFNFFDDDRIKGGSRGREGYGFYFTDMPYKACEYGENLYAIKKDDFRFIDLGEELNISWFKCLDYKYQKELLNVRLSDVRSNREYDYYQSKIDELDAKIEECNGEDPYSYIEKAVRVYDARNYGELFQQVENPDMMWPKIASVIVENGYDGGYYDGVYTVFNFEKLNDKMMRIDTNKE